MKRLTILGSTGSIGVQTLMVAEARGYSIAALTAGGNDQLLEQQILKFRPAMASLRDEVRGRTLAERLSGCGTRILWGEAGVLECAAYAEADMVVNAIVGIAGLQPTLAALSAGHPLALANKESLVCAGAHVIILAKRMGVPILPVDSEHSAIFQCLSGSMPEAVEELILTASGGPFFGMTAEQMANKTAEEALQHPSWHMGKKITVDSATMMNKGFEIMEAYWLFGVPAERIQVVIHRESIVHSLVAFRDGAVLAQLSPPDMRLPIQCALDWPERCPSKLPRLDLAKLRTLTFFEPDVAAFPAMSLCRGALAKGGNAGAALNGANEEAVRLFLENRILFGEIVPLAQEGAAKVPYVETPLPEDIFETDRAARARVYELYRQRR